MASLGGSIIFTCLSLSPTKGSTIEWLLNDASLNDVSHVGVSVEDDVRVQIVNVRAELNNTRIQCIVDTTPSKVATLLVQGKKEKVHCKNRSVCPDVIYAKYALLISRWCAFQSVGHTFFFVRVAGGIQIVCKGSLSDI